MWGFTPEESVPYIEQCSRDILFREAIIAFLGADGKPKNKNTKQKINKSIGEYCQGRDINECYSYFGDNLLNICSTCPQ